MPLIWTKPGSLAPWDVLRPAFFDTLGIALFVNDFVPTVNSVLADFTEASFPGYAPGTINTPNAAFLNGQGYAEADADLVTFTSTGISTQRVYGFFCYDLALTVICAQRFPASVPFFATGTSLDVGVKFAAKSQFDG